MLETLLKSELLEDRVLVRFETEKKEKYKQTETGIYTPDKVEDEEDILKEVEVVKVGDGIKANGEKILMTIVEKQNVLIGRSTGLNSAFEDGDYEYRFIRREEIIAVL